MPARPQHPVPTPARSPGAGGRRLRVWLLTLGLFTLPAAQGNAAPAADPEYLIRAWETEDGLPENSATAMAQTPDGYLWFGTFEGLVRFDGVRFVAYTPANLPGLPSAAIVNLHGDALGRLWVSTDRGLCRLADGGWRTFTERDGWVGNYVRNFASRPNGDVLFATFDGQVLEYAADHLRVLPPPPGERGRGYFTHVDEAGRWWVIQHAFAGYWDGENWKPTATLETTIPDAVGAGSGPDGSLWIVDGQRLRRWSQGKEQASVLLPEPPGGIWSVRGDRSGNVWICTYNQGLCRVSASGDFQRWDGTRGSLEDSTRFVLEDREGSLWVGTSGGGLLQFRPRRFHAFGTGSGRGERNVHALWPASAGGMWLATFGGGLVRWRPGWQEAVALPGSLSRTIYGQTVIEDRSGTTWFGSLHRGLWQITEEGTRLLDPVETGGKSIRALYEDSKGRVWVGGDTNLGLFETGLSRPLPPTFKHPLPGVVAIAEQGDLRLWFSNLKGVFRLDSDEVTEVLGPTGTPLLNVLCFKPDGDGSVWMGTRHTGLWQWKAGKLARVDRATGFPAAGAHAILEDDAGCFWMPSRQGVVRASRAALTAAAQGGNLRGNVQLLTSSDGLPSLDMSSGSQPVAARDAEGRLWFATLKGMAMVEPRLFRANTNPPPVHIEALSYRVPSSHPGGPPTIDRAEDHERRLENPFPARLRLPAGSRRLEIQYTATTFVAPEKARFQVKLEKVDNDWRDAGTRRQAAFNDLAPGDYVFRVRAANNDQVWNENGATLAFTILPHYWQTVWFRASSGLFLVGLGATAVWTAARRRLRRAEERERTAHQMRELAGRLITAQEDERRRIARELHDDFSQRLALLSVEMDLYSHGGGTPTPHPKTSLEMMAERVRELSSEVHRLAHELHPAKLDQLGLVAAARGFCRDLSQQTGVAIHFAAEPLPAQLPPGHALCLYRLLQESLWNVARHSGAKTARVELRTESDHLQLTVADAGAGFDPVGVQARGGLGLASMRERVRLVQGELAVESSPGGGTRIFVRIPLPPST